jgi:hypothetical protein
MVEQKHWKYIAAGAAAFIGAAVVWNMCSGDEEEAVDDIPDDKLLESLKANKLENVRKDRANPSMIDTQYFLELLQFIGQSVRDQQKGEREECILLRREALKNKDEEAYTGIVRKMLEAEEAAVHAFLKRVLDIVSIDQQEFEMTHGKLANDPTTAEYVMAAQQGKLKQQKPDLTKKPALCKSKTLDYLKKSQSQAME